MESPTFTLEKQYWQTGATLVAGLDEAGMGALAGPVVAAAVVFKQHQDMIPIIRDSKTLSAKQREEAAFWLKENVLAWGAGEASVEEITALNIRRAAHLAMQRAVEELSLVPDLLLIDGTPAQVHPLIPASNIIKGDSVSYSIAAASIVAKMHRDRIMIDLDARFPAYGFAAHKGYGSKQHLDALAVHGPCSWHRPTYAPIAKLLTT